MSRNSRRIVTGLDGEGRSTILFDNALSGEVAQILWYSDTAPADNSGREDEGGREFSFDLLRTGGSVFLLAEVRPGDTYDALMHATDTIDYVVVIRGRIELLVETGSVELGAGDCVVDRGILHGWRALGGEPALIAVAAISATPVGEGATL